MGTSPGCLFGFYPCHWGQAPPSLTQGLARADSSGGRGQRSLSPSPTSPSSAAHVISVRRQEYDVSQEWQDAGYPGSFENTSIWEGRSYKGPRRGRLVGVGRRGEVPVRLPVAVGDTHTRPASQSCVCRNSQTVCSLLTPSPNGQPC